VKYAMFTYARRLQVVAALSSDFPKQSEQFLQDTPRQRLAQHANFLIRIQIGRTIDIIMSEPRRAMARTRQPLRAPPEASFPDLNLPTPELLGNASIADTLRVPQAPPTIVSDEQAKSHRRELFLLSVERAQYRYEYAQERQRAQTERLHQLRETSMKAEDRLEAHNRLTHDLSTELIARLQKWEKDDKPTYDAFINHFLNATLATDCMARRYQIVSWFIKDIPRNVSRQIERLTRHYSKTACLVYRLRLANIPLGWDDRWHCEVCKRREDHTWSALQHTRGGFGYEEEELTNGFSDCQGGGEGVERVVHLFVNFEVRKLRMDHAARKIEPTSNGDLPIDRLMDRMADFLVGAMKALRAMLTAAKAGEGGGQAQAVIRMGLGCLKRMEEFEIGLVEEMSSMEIDGVPMTDSEDEKENVEPQGESEIEEQSLEGVDESIRARR